MEKLKHKEAKWPGQVHPFHHMACWLYAVAGFISGPTINPHTYTAVSKLQNAFMSIIPCVPDSNYEMDGAEGQILMFS